MTHMQACVFEFHQKHNLPINVGELRLDETMLLRLRLISEEAGELTAAIHENDQVEIADALGDLMYVVFGTAVTYNYELVFISTDFAHGRERLQDKCVIQALRLNEKIGSTASAFMERNPVSVRLNLEMILHRCLCIADLYGMPLIKIFNEVHRSNMTKPLLDKNRKGGKGAGFSPVNMDAILFPG